MILRKKSLPSFYGLPITLVLFLAGGWPASQPALALELEEENHAFPQKENDQRDYSFEDPGDQESYDPVLWVPLGFSGLTLLAWGLRSLLSPPRVQAALALPPQRETTPPLHASSWPSGSPSPASCSQSPASSPLAIRHKWLPRGRPSLSNALPQQALRKGGGRPTKSTPIF